MLYLKRWLADPLSMGSVAPASVSLRRRVAAAIVRGAGEYVVETGGGTGSVTLGLLEAGVPPHRLIVIEIDPKLAEVLRESFPGVDVVQGDARRLPEALPRRVVGRVGTVVCGIPLVTQPWEWQRTIVESMFSVMPAGRRFLHYSYCLTSPLSCADLKLRAERLAVAFANFPPASVWAYYRDSQG